MSPLVFVAQTLTSTRDPCKRFNCQNGGTCYTHHDVPICRCPVEFTGTFCEELIITRDPCFRNSCENGGTCVAPADYQICHCVSGFGGDRCEKKVPVKPGICNNTQNPDNGTCVKTCSGDYDCLGSKKCCPTFCESICTDQIIINPCQDFICQNGGTCTAPADDPECLCPVGFTGTTCETSVRPAPGKCPDIVPGDVGQCGGLACVRDRRCPKGQKCCKSTCGGRYCTNIV